VRGKVVIEADKLARSGKSIIYTNIGNPHSVGQSPLTWPRQVLSLVDLPPSAGVDHPDVLKLYPSDAVSRARELQSMMGGSGTGAYSHSQGVLGIRQDVADFCASRDGVPCDPDLIFLTNGASAGISHVLQTCVSGEDDGVMIPIPQYPIYSATLALLGGRQVGYALDEGNGWEANVSSMERSLQEAKDAGVNVRAFVLINPGNPTGQVLSKEAVGEVVKFCAKHGLVLLADEVYQENVYCEG
jgi:aspartate/methionine/tyrosine aminotransferase